MLSLLKSCDGNKQSMGGEEEFKKSRRRPRLDAETRKCIGELLGLLNRFVTAAVSGNLIVSAVEALEEYMEDRLGFIRSVMLSLRFLHPEFISGLEAAGLTETEIGYCCLYCIGMNGSENRRDFIKI